MAHVLSDEAVEEIRRLFREESAKFRNPEPLRQRWHRQAGGSADIILFEIDPPSGYDCDSVEATVIAGPCHGSPAIGDMVTVYDEAGCNFDVPADDLIGLVGFATRLRVELTDAQGYPTGETECRWVVLDLCCGAVI